MSGIKPIPGAIPPLPQGGYESGLDKTQEGGFARRLGELVGEVDRLKDHASETTLNMISGEVTDVHEVMIAQEEAGVAFTLMLEIRNRLLEAYQELMRMQV